MTVFTSRLCGMCRVLKGWLAEMQVAYREIDIDLVPEARRELRGLARGYLSVPTVVFEDGRVLVEPRREQLLEALRDGADRTTHPLPTTADRAPEFPRGQRPTRP